MVTAAWSGAHEVDEHRAQVTAFLQGGLPQARSFLFQQTSVARVLPKYDEWLRKYPSLDALAAATPARPPAPARLGPMPLLPRTQSQTPQ